MASAPQMVPFIGATYELQGVSMASRHSVNCYLQSGDGQAKYQQLLLGTPGTIAFQELSALVGGDTVGCRGIWMTDNGPSEGSLYWVFGSKLGKTTKDPLTGTYSSIVITDIGYDSTRVSMCDNGGSLIAVNGTDMYIVDLFTDAVNNITTTLPFNYPTQVVYLSGRIVAITDDDEKTVKKNTGEVLKNQIIWWSEPGITGELTWDALSFASAEASADPIKTIAVRQGDIWAFGTRSYQVFAATTNPDSAFEYAGGSSTSIGINARYSSSAIGDTVFWLGSNASGKNIVFMATGYNSIRISNHGIESILTQYGDLTTQCYGFAYQEAGHLFYCLTIPPGTYNYEGSDVFTDGRTLVYDVTTEQWHERASREPLTGKQKAWQPLFAVYGWGKILVGNLLWSTIMELRNDIYTDYDIATPDKKKIITREIQGPVMFENLQNFILDEFQLDMVVGHGPLNGLSSKPRAMMQVSRDSGNTWSSIRFVDVPTTGNYAGRVRWLRLGLARNFVIRIIFSEDMQFMAGGSRTRSRICGAP
jgi:hypothetical protein